MPHAEKKDFTKCNYQENNLNARTLSVPPQTPPMVESRHEGEGVFLLLSCLKKGLERDK